MIGPLTTRNLQVYALAPRSSAPAGQPPSASSDRVELGTNPEPLRRRVLARRIGAAAAAALAVVGAVGLAADLVVRSHEAPQSAPAPSLAAPAPRKAPPPGLWIAAPQALEANPAPQPSTPWTASPSFALETPAPLAGLPQAASKVPGLSVNSAPPGADILAPKAGFPQFGFGVDPGGPQAIPMPGAPARETSASLKPWLGRTMYENLKRGSRGAEVADLQKTLLKWMPSWEKHLAADGVYGETTAKAVATFKKIYGFGEGGEEVGPRAAFALRDIDSGSWWSKDPATGKSPYSIQKGMGDLYNRAVHGHPFDQTSPFAELAQRAPETRVTFNGFPMQARTAHALYRLERAMRAEGYSMHVTCTTGGQHASWQHPAGRAVDFAVLKDGSYIDDLGWNATVRHSERVAQLARKVGFEALNEYLADSFYKTGPHLHLAV